MRQILKLLGMSDEWLLEKCEPILTRLDDVERLAHENVEARKELTIELRRYKDGMVQG